MGGARLGVVWDGDFTGPASMAHVNRELARRLAGRVDLALTPRDGVIRDAVLAPLAGRRLPRVDVVVRHGANASTAPPRVGRWIWMTPWEYGASLPIDWLRATHGGAAASPSWWVYSAWTRQHFLDCGMPAARVTSVPLGVDVARFAPDANAASIRDALPAKATRFLFMGRLTHRKGIDVVLAAYYQAFTAADDVALIVKPCEAPGISVDASRAEILGMFAGPDRPAVAVLPAEMKAAALPALYASCSALVHPYRGESFCLPIAEAMACGLPVIATDRGAAAAFATTDTATLIASTIVHLPRLHLGGRRVSNFPHWQEPAVDALAAAMRRACADDRAVRAKAAAARTRIAACFTWDEVAEAAQRALESTATAPMRGDRAIEAAAPDTRAATLALAEAHFQDGDLDAAAAACHRCLGRAALLDDRGSWRATGLAIAREALRGLERVARARGRTAHARRFQRYADHLYARTPAMAHRRAGRGVPE